MKSFIARCLLPVACCLFGCAHTQKAAPREQTVTMEPMVFQAQPDGTVETVDAAHELGDLAGDVDELLPLLGLHGKGDHAEKLPC